jgi:hypothetical protein
MKRGKIRLLLECLMCHAATRKEGLFLFFLKNFQFFKKNKNKPPPFRRSVAH